MSLNTTPKLNMGSWWYFVFWGYSCGSNSKLLCSDLNSLKHMKNFIILKKLWSKDLYPKLWAWTSGSGPGFLNLNQILLRHNYALTPFPILLSKLQLDRQEWRYRMGQCSDKIQRAGFCSTDKLKSPQISQLTKKRHLSFPYLLSYNRQAHAYKVCPQLFR